MRLVRRPRSTNRSSIDRARRRSFRASVKCFGHVKRVIRYAPPGRHLIAAAAPGFTGADLEQQARSQLTSWWGPSVQSWTTLRVDEIEYGQPDQTPHFSPKRSVEVKPNLYVCGDHRDTGSIQGALYSGRRCAEAILQSRT